MVARFALIQTHDDSIRRYQRLLNTQLTDLEREYIQIRISEERLTCSQFAKTRGEVNSFPANRGGDWHS
ncbi:hypothetical protein [Bradyrhizobium canariense]|uniref:hypothetical protein n=1 Tax=Bradyrhizobium canariense TaxID=255045 RepID=UPI001B8A2CFC|nr:hypothetical protein [Bradyrhizobium canariense]MBR0952591.1 hypothetical protein [Bradyrhizobium canariense]